MQVCLLHLPAVPGIANVLATCVRTHAAKPPAEDNDIPADVHAALTVLVARDTTRDGALRLDLQAARLPGLDFGTRTSSATSLRHANLSFTDLREADLRSTDLRGTYLDLKRRGPTRRGPA